MTSGDDKDSTPPPATSPPPAVPEVPKVSTWKLPEGIEDHLAKGVVEAGIGMAAGGIMGVLMFKSGSGWRSASIAAGFGVAIGSTFERIRKSYN